MADPSEVLSARAARAPIRTRTKAREYTGCTAYDWATAWCGKGGDGGDCGICDEQAGGASGCWDECDFSGSVEGKV